MGMTVNSLARIPPTTENSISLTNLRKSTWVWYDVFVMVKMLALHDIEIIYIHHQAHTTHVNPRGNYIEVVVMVKMNTMQPNGVILKS